MSVVGVRQGLNPLESFDAVSAPSVGSHGQIKDSDVRKEPRPTVHQNQFIVFV